MPADNDLVLPVEERVCLVNEILASQATREFIEEVRSMTKEQRHALLSTLKAEKVKKDASQEAKR